VGIEDDAKYASPIDIMSDYEDAVEESVAASSSVHHLVSSHEPASVGKNKKSCCCGFCHQKP
jgi:hypothetical protein